MPNESVDESCFDQTKKHFCYIPDLELEFLVNSEFANRKVRTNIVMLKRGCSTLATAFEIIARSRKAERNFSEQRIHQKTLRKLLELSQLAPSSFNLQPYKLIVVSGDQRLALSSGMLGGNSDVVSKAPLSIVFLSDKG